MAACQFGWKGRELFDLIWSVHFMNFRGKAESHHFPFTMWANTRREPSYPSNDDRETAHIPLVIDIPQSRVLIVGRSGTGKSSLINRLLNEQARIVQAGSSCKEDPKDVKSSNPSISVIFHDRPGFEHEHFHDEKERLNKDVLNWNRSVKPANHCAAVLIVTDGRFVDAERLLAQMADRWKIPLGIVFTKQRLDDLGKYDVEPNNADETQNLELINNTRKELRSCAIDPNTVKMFFVNSVCDVRTDNVGGFERLARELKHMVNQGLKFF
jgi:GTP-binding protein EngB required for normal cell division